MILRTRSPIERMGGSPGQAVTCPTCAAAPGVPCTPGGNAYTHRTRLDKVQRVRNRIARALRGADSQG